MNAVLQKYLAKGELFARIFAKPYQDEDSRSFSTRGVGDPGSRPRWTSWLKGLYHRTDVLVLVQELSAGTDTWWGLGRQGEFELFEQDFVIGFWIGVAA